MSSTRTVGSMVRLGPSKFKIRVYAGLRADGKRAYVASTFHGTKKDAEAAKAKMQASRDKGERVVAPRRSRDEGHTLNTYLDAWLADLKGSGRIRERSYYDYETSLAAYIRPALGKQSVTSLTKFEVAATIKALTKRGLSARTVLKARASLRAALESAVADEIIPNNPARGAGNKTVRDALPKVEKSGFPTLPEASFPGFQAAAARERLSALFVVLLHGGFRPSEALALRWSDVRDGTVYVRRSLVDHMKGRALFTTPPKTKKSDRAVMLPVVAVDALKAHRARQAAERLKAGADWTSIDLIFCTELGGFLRQKVARAAFKRILKAADLPPMRVYDCRHAHATWLLEQGVDISVVSERLGHSSITLTVDTYGHISKGMQSVAVAALDRLGHSA